MSALSLQKKSITCVQLRHSVHVLSPAPVLMAIATQHPPAQTSIQQQFPTPTVPFAASLADQAPTALHIPTLQAIQRIQQQANPAPTMVPVTPQLHPVTAQATMPRDPTEYTQANFPSLTKTAGRSGAAGDAGPTSAAQQRTQRFAAKPPSTARWTCAEHRPGPHTAHQHRTPSESQTGCTDPTSFRATHCTTRGDANAPSIPQTTQQKPDTASTSTSSPIQKPPPRPKIPQRAKNPPAPTQGPSIQVLEPPQPRPTFFPPQQVPTGQATSARLKPHSGENGATERHPQEGHSQSSAHPVYGSDAGSCTPAAAAPITVPTIQLHGGPNQQ